MTFARATLAFAALAGVASAPRAVARDLWKSEDEKSVLEFHAFYKTFGYALALPDGLVDGTEALSNVVGQARQVLPPDQAALLPATGSLPDAAGLSSHVARFWGRAVWADRLELSVGWQIVATIASDPALASGIGLGTVQTGVGQVAKRRLVDFDPTLLSEEGLLITHNLDLLALKWKWSFGELVAGRQVLSWGTGRFWNPTDLLSPFAPTDIDKEVRHGVDAVRLSLKPNSTSLVDLLWLPQQSASDNGGVARFQANILGYDVSVSAAKYVSDVVAGADFAGDVGPISIHGEAAYTWGLLGLGTDNPIGVGDKYLRAVGGADVRPNADLFFSAEYYFNGYGAMGPSGYIAKETSFRERSGQVFGAGRHYLGLSGVWKATDLLSVSLSAIGNLQDPSAIVLPMLEYWFEQSVIVRLGGYVPIGRRPDPTGLQRLTLCDLVQDPANPTNPCAQPPKQPVFAPDGAFVAASSTFGLQSEYGASPWGVFVEVAIYL